MIQFDIKHGQLSVVGGVILGDAYAGNGECLNNPAMCQETGHGPLPVGFYVIESAVNRPESTGQFSIPLTPDITNQMYGRSGFFVHGDNQDTNFTASYGCIVTSRDIRNVVAKHQILQVVSGE